MCSSDLIQFGTVELPPAPPENVGVAKMFRHNLAPVIGHLSNPECTVIDRNESIPRIRHEGFGLAPLPMPALDENFLKVCY